MPTPFILTFAQLKLIAEHAQSGTSDTRTPTEDIVNGAIEWLVQCHRWSWRETITTLDVVNGAAQIALPYDFGELIDIQGNADLKGNSFRKAAPRFVQAARINNGSLIASTYSYVYFLGNGPVISAAVPTARTIELGPTPQASAAAGIMLTYLKLLPPLVGDTDVPAIPFGFFQLLRFLVRAFTVSNQTQQSGHDWEVFNRMLPDYIAADSLASGANVGAMESQLETDFRFQSEATLGPGTQVLMPGDY